MGVRYGDNLRRCTSEKHLNVEIEAAELEAVTAKSETGSTTTYEPDTTIEEEMYPAKRNRNCGSHKMKCRTLSKF